MIHDSENNTCPAYIFTVFYFYTNADPLMWNVDHVKIWLTWAVGQFNLEGIDVENFNMTGQDLCSLEHEQFVQLIPNDVDNIFWTHLELLRKCKFVGEHCLQYMFVFSLNIIMRYMW